jgi:hypothetical protein
VITNLQKLMNFNRLPQLSGIGLGLALELSTMRTEAMPTQIKYSRIINVQNIISSGWVHKFGSNSTGEICSASHVLDLLQGIRQKWRVVTGDVYNYTLEDQTIIKDQFVCVGIQEFIRAGGVITSNFYKYDYLQVVKLSDYPFDSYYILNDNSELVHIRNLAKGSSGGEIYISNDGGQSVAARTNNYISGFKNNGTGINRVVKFYVDQELLQQFVSNW